MLLIARSHSSPDEALAGRQNRAARWIAWLLWLLVGLSAGFWVHQWRAQTERHESVRLGERVAAQPVPTPGPRDLGLWLGAAPAQAGGAPAEVNEQTELRRQVIASGVASGPAGEGLALLAVNGQPVRPFTSGSVVLPGWVLSRVTPRTVELSRPEGGATVVLPLPERPNR